MLNNPLIPGDPCCYDLMWLVAKVKEILAQLGTIDEAIETKIFEGFLEHSVVQFKTVPEMLAADITDGSIVLTLGYHEAGDQGGLFYLVKDFNPSQCALDYFLTLDNNQQIAIPIIATPYVMPEMFGAYGDGIADDTEAIKQAFKYDNVLMVKTYKLNDSVDLQSGQRVSCYGKIDISDYDIDGLTAPEKVFRDNAISDFEWDGGTIEGAGTGTTGYLSLFRFEDASNVTIKNLRVLNTRVVFVAGFYSSSDVVVDNVYIDHYSYAGVCFYDGTKHASVRNCVIKNLDTPGAGTGYPISLSGGDTNNFATSEDVEAINNTVDNSATIARWEGIDAHGGTNIRVIGNTVKGCIYGISVFNQVVAPTWTLDNAVISDNVIIGRDDGNLGHGITIGGTNCVVSNNVVKNFKQIRRSSGIYIRSCKNTNVAGNTIEECNIALLLGPNDEGVYIHGNVINTCGGASENSQDMAITGVDLQTSTIIEGNILIKLDGVLRLFNSADQYVVFINNKMIDIVNYLSSNQIFAVCDILAANPSTAQPRGKTGDIVKRYPPAAGQPVAWICTSGWDGSSVTWTAMANL